IPYGLDTQEFSPRGKEICRQALGIPEQSRVILFVAQSSAMRRKGFELFQQALTKLPPGNLLLLSVGGGESAMDGSIRRLHLGNVEHDRILSLAYGAADVFVIPSMQDNLPNTVLESMACGTPVVGFCVGGIPDMVRPGETGALAPAGNVDALATAIRTMLDDDEERRRMGENCRRVALEEYDAGAQARRYISLYTSLLETKTQ
ncbi:MAG TPA: glycosyltransferase, partial [Humisphaera sp.]|nr:glycosyltransferase [Humisphaera sp.]